MWLTRNNCNNMHGFTGICPTSIPMGDNYLKGLVPNILNSNTFNTQRAALFIVFDEGNGWCPLNGSSEDKFGIVRTFPPKTASDCIPALIADRLPSEQSPLPGDVGRFDEAPMAGSPGAERHEAVSIRVLKVS